MSKVNEVLGRLLSSEVKGDILVLFHSSPGLIDTVDGVACRIGRRANDVESDVGDLVDLGVLKLKRIGRHRVILLNQSKDEEIQNIIENQIKDLKKGNK